MNILTKVSNFQQMVRYHVDMIRRNYDRVIAIDGEEGRGKSRGPFLHFMDEWYQALGKPLPNGRYGVDIAEFKKALLTAQPFDIAGLDEAGDKMQKEEYRNKFNRGMYKAYTVIRERKICTLLTMPSFADFAKGFRKRRIHGLIHVSRRVDNKCLGCHKQHVLSACPHCGSKQFKPGFIIWRYYNRKNLNRVIYLNRNREVFTLNLPGIEYKEGILREYKGPLIEEYIKLKEQKTTAALEEFTKIIDELAKEDEDRKCPNCGSGEFRWVAKEQEYKCRNCPMTWPPSDRERKHIEIKKKEIAGGVGISP